MKEVKTIYHKEFKLRYVVLCNGTTLQQWQVNCLDQLQQLDFVEPVLLVLPKQNEQHKKSFFQKIKVYPYSLFFYRLSKRLFKHPLQKAVALPEYLQNVQQLQCAVALKGKYSQYFSTDDIKQIQSHQPHFIIRFGFNIIRGEILNCTPYGVWSFHHGNEEEYRGGPPCFWEVYQDKKTVGAILQKLTNELDAGVILRKGNFPVTRFSVRETLTRNYNLSSIWLKQVCIDLGLQQASYINNSPSASKAKVYTFPRNHVVLAYSFKKIFRKFGFHYRDLFKPENWMVGIVQLENEYQPGQKFPKTIEWIKSSNANGYSADPFIIQHQTKTYVLVEEYDYRSRKGKIDVIDLETKARRVLIDEDFHLSYPFTLECKNDIYVLPEAAESGKLTLYKVNLESSSIVEKFVLVDSIKAYDPTLFYHEGHWWLFVTQKETESNTCLHLYYSQNLLGDYIPHVNNPVKANIANARPAGKIMQVNNMLYRPAQNSSQTYGGSVVMNLITELTPTTYKEDYTEEIFPDQKRPFNEGLHTINANGNLMVFDCKKHQFNRFNFGYKLLKKLRMRR